MPQLLNEKELEDYLYAEFNKYDRSGNARHELLTMYVGDAFRQVTMEGYGTADIILIDTDYDYLPKIIVTIVELKKDLIDFNAIGQICRYKKAIERMYGKNEKFTKKFEMDVKGVLIGSGVQKSGDCVYILNELAEWLDTWSYSITLDGISFEDEGSGWFGNNEDFTNLEARFLGYFHDKLKPRYRELHGSCAHYYQRQNK